MSGNAVQIFEVLVQYLVVEHIDYAVELGLQGERIIKPSFSYAVEMFTQ